MLVPVTFVRRMPVAVVDEVRVVAMTDGRMAAVRPVFVIMALMRHVSIVGALIPMVVMEPVGVAFMQVIGVVSVRDGDMAAPFAVDVFMGVVHFMSCGHTRRPSSFGGYFRPRAWRSQVTVGPRLPGFSTPDLTQLCAVLEQRVRGTASGLDVVSVRSSNPASVSRRAGSCPHWSFTGRAACLRAGRRPPRTVVRTLR